MAPQRLVWPIGWAPCACKRLGRDVVEMVLMWQMAKVVGSDLPSFSKPMTLSQGSHCTKACLQGTPAKYPQSTTAISRYTWIHRSWTTSAPVPSILLIHTQPPRCRAGQAFAEWVRRQKKVCVSEIGLQFRASFVNFSFPLRNIFLMGGVDGSAGAGQGP